MSKPALGRGLGDLMPKAASPKTIPDTAPPESEPSAGPGVRSLLAGRGREISEPAKLTAAPTPIPDTKKAPSPDQPFPRWYLFAADVVLLLFAFLLVFKDPANLDWKRISLAIIVTMLGGALAALGVLLGRKK